LLLLREHAAGGLLIAHSSPECVQPYIRHQRKRKRKRKTYLRSLGRVPAASAAASSHTCANKVFLKEKKAVLSAQDSNGRDSIPCSLVPLYLFLLLVLHIALLFFLLLTLYLASLALTLLSGFLLLRFVVKQGSSTFVCFWLWGLLLIGTVASL
jgi:Flp pilus assembly protein TadB